MKKFLRRLIVIALLVGLLPTGLIASSVASAAPAEALGALAAYFPAETPLFATARIDDGHIETLNGLLNTLAAYLPEGTLLPDSLHNDLDNAIRQHFPEGSFAETVDPWLGDFAAVGVTTFGPLVDDDLDNDSELPSAIIAQITDREGAEAFFETVMAANLGAGYFEVSQTADFTLYEAPDPDIPIQLMITDDLLILALAGFDPAVAPRSATLDSNATFQQALAALPAESYNVALYLSGEGLKLLAGTYESELPATLQASVATLDEWAGLMVGLTILDDTVLTIDSVGLTDTDTSAAALAVLGGSGTLSPTFDAFLAGDAQFVSRGVNLREYLTGAINLALESDPTAKADLEEVATNIRTGFQQMLGLDVDEDVVSWLTGEYALTLSLDPSLLELFAAAANGAPPSLERFPIDVGLVVEAVDATKAQALVAALSDRLPALLAQDETTDVTISLETIGDGSALVITVPIEGDVAPFPSLEILIGASEDVFALGTRAVVTAALDPGEGLPVQTAYTQARSYALPDAVSFGYVSQAGVQSLGNLFAGAFILGPEIGTTFEQIESGLIATLTPDQLAEQERQMEEQRQQSIQAAQLIQTQVQTVLSLIDNLAVSTAADAEGVYRQRITLTLAP